MHTSRTTSTCSSWRRRIGSRQVPPQAHANRYPRADLSSSLLSNRAQLTHLAESLHTCGFLIVKIPAEVIEAVGMVDSVMRKFFAQTNATKNTFRTPQEGERVLSHPAYLTPSPGWSELFEVRRSCCDPTYRFPPGCKEACFRLFDVLRKECMRWLALLSLHLCGDETRLNSLADADTGPAVLRVLHYDEVPKLGAQLSQLPQGSPAHIEARRNLMAGFPTHTDSSLVTLAPRASVSGLAVRHFKTCKWLRVERQMAKDEAVLFCGDALSFLSRHYFPACMHRPDGLESPCPSLCRTGRGRCPIHVYPHTLATHHVLSCCVLHAQWPERFLLHVYRPRSSYMPIAMPCLTRLCCGKTSSRQMAPHWRCPDLKNFLCKTLL
jgi:isopenicillin N synthase-like dioxygenase